MLLSLAKDTWRFFDEMDAALPPDNNQLDPPAAPVRRTSPTNIGLYLLSCLAARELKIIDPKACAERVRRALDACDGMPKWKGHLYNWVDIDALRPLPPRYVSAVDSGNLAACALACAGMIGDEALARRLRALAEDMDFRALFDEKRQLFCIGADVENDVLSESHYDLLASEARILSFTAILLGQIPMEHWRRLGRACVAAGGGAALLSWSGTMFEYLMPELLMRAPALSLLGESARAAVNAQRAAGTPWGVSESGYHAFDARMNYQYRAFGLDALSLGGAAGGVIAPYASALALAVLPREAAENMERMSALGWRGERGFYEAADFLRPGADGRPALVRSHMAHHQGMTLCAICNALTGDKLVRGFMDDPRARAIALLLEERPVALSRRRPPKKPVRGAKAAPRLAGRDPDAAKVYVRVNGLPTAPQWRAVFDPGDAFFDGRSIAMTVSLSPEDDTLYRLIEVRNDGETTVSVEVMDVLPVALCRPEDWRAHSAFQRLFVESARLGEDGLIFTRRPRDPGEACPVLIHRAGGFDALEFETDYDRLAPRGREPSFELSGALGAVLDPVSALKATVRLRPGETRRLCFAMKLAEDGEARTLPLRPERAAHLAGSRMAAMLGFLGLNVGQYHIIDRLAARLADPHLNGEMRPSPCDATLREALWALGISGDAPIISLWFTDPAHAGDAKLLLSACAFYAAMGLRCDLVLADACPGGYDQPGRRCLTELIDASPLRGRENQPGGVWLLSNLTEEQRNALRRASSIALKSGPAFAARLRALLSMPCTPEETPMETGPTRLAPMRLEMFNGWGGFDRDGSYIIEVKPDHPTPVPWCNILAHERMGLLLTERGGGFLWHENSRSGRMSEYRGDAPWLNLRLRRTQTGEALPLLPMDAAQAFRVRYTPDEAAYTFDNGLAACETRFRLDGDGIIIDITLDNRRLRGPGWTVCLEVRWLMGTDARDAPWLRTWHAEGGCFASGTMPGVGFLT